MLGGRILVVTVAVALVGVVACVGDETIDLNAKDDAGAAEASTGGGGDGGVGLLDPTFNVPNGKPNIDGHTVCGVITSSKSPTCPATLLPGSDDPTCGDGRPPVCCPGRACVERDQTCPDGAPEFPCFTGRQCGEKGTCCVAAKPILNTNMQCGAGMGSALLLKKEEGTSCTCAAGDTQLCTTDEECKTGKCQADVRIFIPTPTGGDAFVRHVGVCK